MKLPKHLYLICLSAIMITTCSSAPSLYSLNQSKNVQPTVRPQSVRLRLSRYAVNSERLSQGIRKEGSLWAVYLYRPFGRDGYRAPFFFPDSFQFRQRHLFTVNVFDNQRVPDKILPDPIMSLSIHVPDSELYIIFQPGRIKLKFR